MIKKVRWGKCKKKKSRELKNERAKRNKEVLKSSGMKIVEKSKGKR